MAACSAGPVEDKSYKVLAKGGTYAHILNPRTDQEKVKAGKAWKDRHYALILVGAPSCTPQVCPDRQHHGCMKALPSVGGWHLSEPHACSVWLCMLISRTHHAGPACRVARQRLVCSRLQIGF